MPRASAAPKVGERVVGAPKGAGLFDAPVITDVLNHVGKGIHRVVLTTNAVVHVKRVGAVLRQVDV